MTHKPNFGPDEWHIGGGGTYAAIGARVWLPPKQILMLIHKGQDFPVEIEEKLLNYSPSLFTFITDPTHPLTTRALNIYSNTKRDFRYLTPKRQIKLIDIASHTPRFVHLICSPSRMSETIEDLQALRTGSNQPNPHFDQSQITNWSPLFVYEPIPDSCVPQNLEKLISLSKHIEVFSPNELEARSFLGLVTPADEVPEEIEDIARVFQNHGFKNVVIRCGKMGAFVLTDEDAKKGTWVPAMIEDQSKVVDQTGGGNAFLGGLMAGLARGFGLVEASYCGSISAGLTISQLGLPLMTVDDDGLELWGNLKQVPEELKIKLMAR